LEDIFCVAEQFAPIDRIRDIRGFGSGNINSTFLVTLGPGDERHFVLQRINTQVFRQPELIMRNMRTISEHVNRRLRDHSPAGERRWEMPRILPAKDGRDHWTGPDGSFWRAISYIENAGSFDIVKDIEHAKEAGFALGMFHSLMSDLPPESLSDTLEGFHITPLYLSHYNEVTAKHGVRRSPEADLCVKFINERSVFASVLEDAKAAGRLFLRPIHGDPKINNIMMDTATGRAVGMIDLDTVKPGLVHYDIGDCLRSGCNPLGEETGQWERVCFDTDICRAVLAGYISTARGFLTGNDYDHMYDAVRLIAFELGLRFFTDYLEGNVYFRVRHERHNLERALVQFRLTESIESREATIRAIIEEMR